MSPEPWILDTLDRLLLPLTHIGQLILQICRHIGRLTVFLITALRHLLTPPHYPAELAQCLYTIGYLSLPIVGLTTLFAGGALALQIHTGGTRFNAEAAVPAIVAIGMVRELGPVLCGLMIAGRIGSSIAAELATMRVSDQIDALETLSIAPMDYLVVPRIAAATLSMPILVGIGDIIGILGGYLVGIHRLGFGDVGYLTQSIEFLDVTDVVSSLVKGALFGFIIAACGCYCGMHAGRGARGVGIASTTSVALSSALIIAANFVLTDVFF